MKIDIEVIIIYLFVIFALISARPKNHVDIGIERPINIYDN